jgi:hypothetical protein
LSKDSGKLSEKMLRFAAAALLATLSAWAQNGQPTAKLSGTKNLQCSGRPVPQLEDITKKAGISFHHTSDPQNKYIVESVGGGVILFDYDRDGWLDIYFTNAPTVEMALRKEKSRGALYQGRTRNPLLRFRWSGRRLQQRRLA